MVTVLTFPDKFARAYPKHPASAVAAGDARELGSLFSTPFDTDVHFVAYATALECRLSTEVLAPEHAHAHPLMVAAVFDVDDPVAHAADHPARAEWWEAEKTKLVRLNQAHPDPFVYRSRGGYRIVFALPQALALRSLEDAAGWRALYLSWRRYLGRRFDVAADRTCSDWTRFFRAPHVMRDGVRQAWETLGDPQRIGAWAPELTEDDRVPIKARGGQHYGAVEPVPIPDPTNVYGRARIAAAVDYLRRAPLSIRGQGGRNVMFAVCTALVRRMRLPIGVAAELIDAVYNPRLAEAGTGTWSVSDPDRYGMNIVERLEKARDTSAVPPGNVIDEETWTRLRLGGVW